jgi:hypothetical protein
MSSCGKESTVKTAFTYVLSSTGDAFLRMRHRHCAPLRPLPVRENTQFAVFTPT